MKLYGHPLSGNSHRVQALLEILGLEYEFILVDLPNGAHKKPDFLALNPLGQVPVFEDGDLVLRDSTAILTYLAEKYDATGAWLPKDAVTRAQVQQWLSVAVHEIVNGPFVVRAAAIFGMPCDEEAVKAKTTDLFDALFEPHLKSNNWLVNATPTVADLACYSYVARVVEGDFSLDAYPAISGWLKRVEGIDKFPAMVWAADLMAVA